MGYNGLPPAAWWSGGRGIADLERAVERERRSPMDFTVMRDVFATAHADSVVLACDVHGDFITLYAKVRGVRVERVFRNRTDSIVEELEGMKATARKAGIKYVLLVAEPTGVHHRVLMRVAEALGMETAWVSGEHVSKMRVVETNDTGKTDTKDPKVIHTLARMGKTLRHRSLVEPYNLLREWHKTYDAAEDNVVAAKCALHNVVRAVFPDLGFSKDFKFGLAGCVLGRRYGFNPYRIGPMRPSRLSAALRKAGVRIQASTLEELVQRARVSAQKGPGEREATVLESRVVQLYEDLDLHQKRKEKAKAAMVELYREARKLDPKLPEGVHGVISTFYLARIVAETGPLSDFPSARQLLRFAGLNLRERNSGKSRGKTKISKKGRTLLRKVQIHMVLPMVREDAVYGEYYARLRKSGLPGTKAMTAVARHFLKVLYGWYRSGAAFDRDRMFTCESQYTQVA